MEAVKLDNFLLSDKTGYTTGDSGGCFKSRGYDSDGSRIM